MTPALVQPRPAQWTVIAVQLLLVTLFATVALLPGQLSEGPGAWHGPDAHSSLPHRAASPSQPVDRSTSAEPLSTLPGEVGRTPAAEPGPLPGRLDVEPPQLPPR